MVISKWSIFIQSLEVLALFYEPLLGYQNFFWIQYLLRLLWRFSFFFLESWEPFDISKVQGNNFKWDAIVQSSAEALSRRSQDEGSVKSGKDSAVRKIGISYVEIFFVDNKKRQICKDITTLCFHAEKSGFVEKSLKFVCCGLDTYFVCIYIFPIIIRNQIICT